MNQSRLRPQAASFTGRWRRPLGPQPSQMLHGVFTVAGKGLAGHIARPGMKKPSCLGASHLLVPLLEMLSLSLSESVSSNFTCRFLREPSRTAPGPPPCPPSPHAMTSSFTWSQSMSVLSTAMRSGTTSVLFSSETQCLPRPRHLAGRRRASQYFE